ncbi:MAG: hypothetical protein M1829_002445 [Trizodia sp. TS-e1964]|nr:MAG: hypothetical protein M1829_002445 [Trizodia sp. TS-e1964]
MGSFNQVHIVPTQEGGGITKHVISSDSLIFAWAGCTTEDIVRTARKAELTVPLGARPSIGAGLWLQGGIGHLARLHGLACDAIVGAIVHQPAGFLHLEIESDLIWAIKGAGNNFGIVISVTFEAFAARTYFIWDWVILLSNNLEARLKITEFDELVANKLLGSQSADAYLFYNDEQLKLGVTLFESTPTSPAIEVPSSLSTAIISILGPEDSFKIADGLGLFETEMYISRMQGRHSHGKTSSFKRYVFLKHIGAENVAGPLVSALKTRPSSLSLAERVNVRLALIRDAGKLPPPVISVTKTPSHISSLGGNTSGAERIEMERCVVRKSAFVVVVDDVLASGKTLCAMLELLRVAGIDATHFSIMVVAEFSVHRGRKLLQTRGWGRVNIQSLFVFGGT